MLVYIILLLVAILKSDAAYSPGDIGLQNFLVTVIDLLICWHLKHKKARNKVLRFRNVMFEVTIDIAYQKPCTYLPYFPENTLYNVNL